MGNQHASRGEGRLHIDEREAFYERAIRELIKDKNASILVCGGGATDKKTLERVGFQNVTISNLDARMEGNEYAPFAWKYENAEALSFAAESFEYVVIHAAIHHSSSPHKVLTEMYRVARKGLLALEARDSVMIRVLERCGFTQMYEHASVYSHDGKYGGVNNTEIPNYVYRWTEREIEKTIQSYAPQCKHTIVYRYGTAFPSTPTMEKKGGLKKALLRFMRPFYGVFVFVFPKQQNLFAVYVEKPAIPKALFSWLAFDNKEGRIVFNMAWADERYKSQGKSRG